jgi:polysaccharide pyruvyl transferase WcaK-like protein
MRILHTYCLNFNIGDYALGIGVKNLLREHLDVSFIGETNIQGRDFNEYYINEVVNKRYDLLVIGGGGIIHGAHWPNGWFWLIDKELIQQIKIPFIVYGVGYNYWEEEGGIPERGIVHLKETIKHATYFSVRNDGSAKRILNQTGIDAPAIPDPGFHINLNTDYSRKIKEPYVIIQIANDKPESRFGSLEKRASFVENMREICSELSENYKILLAPHVPDDISISDEIAKGQSNVDVWDFKYFAFDNSKESLGYYKYADFAIAMRGHGQIVPIAFNTPVIALENHPKHRGLMEELELLEYNVKISDPNFKQILTATIEKLIDNKKSLENQYQLINKKLLSDSAKAFTAIKKQLNG